MMQGRLYRRLKSLLNSWVERLIEPCNQILQDFWCLPWYPAQRVAHGAARLLGDLIWLIVNFPRLNVYELTDDKKTIIFAGSQRALKDINHLLFEPLVEAHEIGRIGLWQISRRSAVWFDEGVDLVVCELGRWTLWRPQAPLHFTTPKSVTQLMDISDDFEALFSGNKRKNIRVQITKALKAGFSYRVSHSEADFEDLYQRLFLPYIQDRHGSLAIIDSHDSQYQVFKKGALVLITWNSETVGGRVGYMTHETYMDVEGGYLHTDPRLKPYGVNAFITWASMKWAKDQGAKIYDIGISNAWRSDGVFTFKRRLGTHVVRPKMIYRRWHFLAKTLSPEFCDQLNQIGFISEVNGHFYGVHLHTSAQALSDDEIKDIRISWADEGIDGIIIVSPNRASALYTCVEDKTDQLHVG